MDPVATRIRERLTALGLKPHPASVLAGLSPRQVSKLLERGAENAHTKTLAKLAPVLGVSVEWLMTGKGPAPEASPPAAPEAPAPAELRMVPDGDARPSLGAHPDAEALAREIREENPALAPYVDIVLSSGSMRSLDIPLTRSALETLAKVVQSHGQRRGR